MKHFKVFVFGTLKEGFPNFYLNKGIKSSGDYLTARPYLFYLVGERYTPCIYENDGKGAQILGEIYTVNKEQLNILDELERIHETDGYIRSLVKIINTQNTDVFDAYIYLKSATQMITSNLKVGPIDCYLPEHAKLYQYRTKD